MFRRLMTTGSLAVLCFASCKHSPQYTTPVTPEDNFPPEVGKIITTKCATAGCHNAASYQTSGGGLLLDSWQHLFDGGNTGAVIVPFSPENSSLLYFTNAHEDLGPIPPDEMKMPLNSPPLSREEYITLRDWVMAGAPDKSGNIPFASNAATRQKVYVLHQGCDYVSVIDAEKNVVMRCIPVGILPTIETGYSFKIASNGLGYVNFWSSEVFQKIDTKTDQVIEQFSGGYPNSSGMLMSPDGNELVLSNSFMNALLRVQTESGQMLGTYGSGMTAPHGVAANRHFDTFFVTEQYGNAVYKLYPGGQKKISVDDRTPSGSGGPGVYNIVMSPDFSRYFVSCQHSNEVRVMDARADTLIAVIPVGSKPQELLVSRSKPYLFVSCEEDPNMLSLFKGSVYIINYNTFQIVERIAERFYMPHAMAVDDVFGKLFVFSRNIDPEGPVPHHNSSVCSGRNGYYSVYDFYNLQPVNNKRYEITIDPFAADTRFK